MKKALILSSALLVVLAACGKKDAPPADPVSGEAAGTDAPAVQPAAVLPDPLTTAVADLPHAITVDDDTLKADVKFDDAIFSFAPAIAMDVVEDARTRLQAMQEDAAAYKEADPQYFRPYGLKIDWIVSGASSPLAGLEGFVYTFTGGAHGNYMTDGRVYDTLTGDQLEARDLFTDSDATAAAIADTVYKAMADAKVARNPDMGNYDTFLGESKDAVGVSDILMGEISLIGSTEPGKLGGLAIHFAPYEIGSYAEGAYHIAVPQAAFHDFLKPEYAAAFAGEPAEIKRADE